MKIDWKKYGSIFTEIDLSFNKITEMNWKGCPTGLTKIDLGFNNIAEMNWKGCRNEFISEFYSHEYFEEYLEYKKTDAFIPYLPIVCKDRKEIHYELESIWWKCPDGILFKEDVKELTASGLFTA